MGWNKDDSCGTYNTGSQIKFKTSMSKSSLCGYSDAYILVSGTIKVAGARTDDNAKWLDEGNKGVISKNYASFTDCIIEINNTQVDHAKHLDFVMPMYDLIEYSNNYWKTIGRLWQYYRDESTATIVNLNHSKLRWK